MENFYHLISNTKEKVLVFGDFIIDIYNEISTKRISEEFPIPVYEKEDRYTKNMGGAGNVLNNLLTLNIDAHLLSIVSNEYIESLIKSKHLINIEDDRYSNIKKIRFFSQNYQCFRLDDKLDYEMSEDVMDKFKKKINNVISEYKIVIISDYNTGIVTPELTKYIINECNKLNIMTIIDPKNKYMLYKNCTIIKPNKKDAEHICNFSIKNIKDAYKACDIIVKKLNIKICIITLSEMGCVVADNDNNTKHIPCTKIVKGQIMDVTGAGDTFISGLTLCLLHSIEISKACEISNILCSDVVKRKQVSCVNLLDILLQYNNVITDTNNCYVLQKYLTNKTIIFTTGCFDLLHEGHIQVLKKAKGLGDILIVALNDDNSIKRLKGSNRPINNLNTRLVILSAIKYIDFIIVFSDDTPNNIYEIIKPDILVKGGDYSFDTIKKLFPNLQRSEFVSVPLINNISTTNIIHKIENIR